MGKGDKHGLGDFGSGKGVALLTLYLLGPDVKAYKAFAMCETESVPEDVWRAKLPCPTMTVA